MTLARVTSSTTYGYKVPTLSATCWNRSGRACAKGELAIIDEAAAQATTWTIGSAVGVYATIISPTAAGCSTARHQAVICAEAIADDQPGTVILQGHVSYALVYKSSGNVSEGDLFIGEVSGQYALNAAATSGYVYYARAEADVTGPSTPAAAAVTFYGNQSQLGVAP